MRSWFKKLEAMAVAATYAEAGEWDTAEYILRRDEKRARNEAHQRKQPARPRTPRPEYRA